MSTLRTRPGVELLEGRDCPAVTMTQTGSLLSIVGNRADDTVVVADQGGGTLQVTPTKGPAVVFRGITQLEGNDAGGDNTYKYFSAVPGAATNVRFVTAGNRDTIEFVVGDVARDVTLTALTGGGDDTVQATQTGTLSGGAALSYQVDLGSGNDSFHFDGEYKQAPAGSDAGSLSVSALGAGGDDLLRVAVRGAVGDPQIATLGVSLGGAGGRDNSLVSIEGVSAETVNVDVAGGSDNDASTVMVQDVNESKALVVRGASGSGDDFDSVTIQDANESKGLLSVDWDSGSGDDLVATVGIIPDVSASGSLESPQPFGPELVQLNFDGADGNDILSGQAIFSGNSGSLQLSGGRGDDTLLAEAYGPIEGFADYSVELDGGVGNDVLDARVRVGPPVPMRTLSVDMQGGDGHDVLFGTSASDIMEGGAGNDLLHGFGGADYLYGSAGTDYLYGDDGEDHLYGGNDADFLYGGNHTDFLYGGGGADQVNGGAGNDWLYGNEGDDVLKGEDGADVVYGGDGNDSLYADPDGYQDALIGEGGADAFYYFVLSSDDDLILDLTPAEGDHVEPYLI